MVQLGGSVQSHLSPREVHSRLMTATDRLAPEASRVLVTLPYSRRPAGLPRSGWLRLDHLDLDGFEFSYIVQRCPWRIAGRVTPDGQGSRIVVNVPVLTAEAIVRATIGLALVALFGSTAWRDRK